MYSAVVSRLHRRLAAVFIVVMITVSAIPAWSEDRGLSVDCRRSTFADDFDSRPARAPTARSEAQLRSLIDRPAQLTARADWIDHAEARIETVTDYHVVYAGTSEQFLSVAQDDLRVVNYVPNLVYSTILCNAPDGTSRIHQRFELNVLFLSIVSEIVLDVRHFRPTEGRGYTEWLLHEGIESDLVYSYGSFYAETVDIGGTPHVYVRHYARTGISTGIIGARAIVGASLDAQVKDWLDAVSQEMFRQYGTRE